MAAIIRDITEPKRAEHYLRLLNEARTAQKNLRVLSSKMMQAQEEDRKRISRELHDEVGQALTAVTMMLATLRRGEVGAASTDIARKLEEAERLVEGSMMAVRDFAREMRPAMLDELGLLSALRTHLRAFQERTKLKVRFRGTPKAEELTGEQKTVMFRVAQEALTNVAKHARATAVSVTLHNLGQAIRMDITDDGQSFKSAKAEPVGPTRGLGLLGMQERVLLVHGEFSIGSRPGKGTTVRVLLPFHPETLAGRGSILGGGKNGSAVQSDD